jgi:hypothetical protein
VSAVEAAVAATAPAPIASGMMLSRSRFTEEGRQMAAEHEDHGNTPAAWTTVITIIVGFTIGSVGVVLANFVVVGVGVVVCILGVVAGKVMSMAGMGKKPADDTDVPTEQSQAA